MRPVKSRFQRYFWICAALHLGVVVFVKFNPLSHKEPKKPDEIITYVNLQANANVPEPPSIVPVKNFTPPKPLTQPVKEFKIPEPPKAVPQPAPTPKKKKRKIKISKKKVKRNETAQLPLSPQLTREEIRKLFAENAPPTRNTTSYKDEIPSWYYALVREKMYQVWEQPDGMSSRAGLIATVQIRVQKNGAITKRVLVQSSGDDVIDQTVMNAVQSVSRLKPLPSEYKKSYKDIAVDFQLAL
ncbi:MAG: TonB family protein [Kiritimatiellae bacterium]|nr:TonB family protein [Kiritimatiellia bacterium]